MSIWQGTSLKTIRDLPACGVINSKLGKDFHHRKRSSDKNFHARGKEM